MDNFTLNEKPLMDNGTIPVQTPPPPTAIQTPVMKDQPARKESRAWHLAECILGILFLIIGFFELFAADILGSLAIMAIGLLILPFSWNFIQKIMPVKLPRGSRVVLIVLLMIIGGTATLGGKNSSISQPDASPTPTVHVTASPTTQVTATPSPQVPLTTEDKLKQSITKVFGDDKVKVKYDSGNKIVTATYGEGSEFFDETGMIEGLITMFVKTGMEVFQIENVDTLSITVRTKFTDSYGKESTEDAATITMDKAEFQKYNWSGLEYRPIYYALIKSTTEFYIHPSVKKNIKVEELLLRRLST